MDLKKLEKNLKARGFDYYYAADAEDAVQHILEQVQNTSVGIGGSTTADQLGLYDKLAETNQVHWHWKELIDNHGISEKRMKFFKDNINISNVFDDMVPTRRPSVMDEYEYIHCSVVLNRRIVGHYVLFGFLHPIAKGMENLVDILIGWMDLYVERHAEQFNTKSSLADAFVGFLEKREYDRAHLAELFHSFKWKMSDPYQILAVREIVNSEPVLLGKAFRKIAETIPDVVVAMHKQHLIILRNLVSETETGELKKQLSDVFKDDFIIGASTPFLGIENSELYSFITGRLWKSWTAAGIPGCAYLWAESAFWIIWRTFSARTILRKPTRNRYCFS